MLQPVNFDTLGQKKKEERKKAVLNICIYDIYTHIYIIGFPKKSAGTSGCLYRCVVFNIPAI